MVGTLDILKRSFQIWHTSLFFLSLKIYFGVFPRYDILIANHISQPYYQIVAMQSNVDINPINCKAVGDGQAGQAMDGPEFAIFHSN